MKLSSNEPPLDPPLKNQTVPVESKLLKQIRNQTLVNKLFYNRLMRYSQGAVCMTEIMSNEQEIQMKYIAPTEQTFN